ncbi:MAG: hypothetical protein RIC56_13385 [Pseudomonadales bacterium]
MHYNQGNRDDEPEPMSSLPENPDLAWDLDEFSDRERAMEFVQQFETTMCVYSPSVEQLYTSYSMFFPQEWQRKLVILPDPKAYHDTFFHIQTEAVVSTGLYIIPGEMVDRHGLYLANVREDRSLGDRQVPFEAGIRAIMGNRPADDQFLPVLAKGDLREFEQAWPVLHLHRVKPRVLERISDLDRTSLTSVIHEKLESLFVAWQKAGVE